MNTPKKSSEFKKSAFIGELKNACGDAPRLYRSIPREILDILSRFDSKGFEAYLVGGCVRDMAMGKKPVDYDITTNARPGDVAGMFDNVVPTGIKHGTITVVYGGFSVEITTFRSESGYSDFRHPDSVSFSNSLNDDLERRDFTMNALCYNPKTGFVDVHGGLSDIEKGIIRAIGNPQERFYEDPLRILRAIRFSAVLGFAIEENTSKAMLFSAQLLKKISSERIYTEFKKILVSQGSFEALVNHRHIFSTVLPEVFSSASKGSETDSSKRFKCASLAASLCPPCFSLRIAALLHDYPTVGATEQSLAEGRVASCERARRALSFLKVDKATFRRTISVLKSSDIPISRDRRDIKRLMYLLSPEVLSDVLELRIAEARANASMAEKRQKSAANKELELCLAARSEHLDIIDKNECVSVAQLKINGDDVINVARRYFEENPDTLSGARNINANFEGKYISELLDRLVLSVIDGITENEKAILIRKVAALLPQVL